MDGRVGRVLWLRFMWYKFLCCSSAFVALVMFLYSVFYASFLAAIFIPSTVSLVLNSQWKSITSRTSPSSIHAHSAAELVQEADSIERLLAAALLLDPQGEERAPHQCQPHHQRRRQFTASQVLVLLWCTLFNSQLIFWIFLIYMSK